LSLEIKVRIWQGHLEGKMCVLRIAWASLHEALVCQLFPLYWNRTRLRISHMQNPLSIQTSNLFPCLNVNKLISRLTMTTSLDLKMGYLGHAEVPSLISLRTSHPSSSTPLHLDTSPPFPPRPSSQARTGSPDSSVAQANLLEALNRTSPANLPLHDASRTTRTPQDHTGPSQGCHARNSTLPGQFGWQYNECHEILVY
jgi:hypothetical protein